LAEFAGASERITHLSLIGILEHHIDNSWKADITIGKIVDEYLDMCDISHEQQACEFGFKPYSLTLTEEEDAVHTRSTQCLD
jgi:hypothetical protein